MEFRNIAIAPSVFVAIGVAATSATAQIGEIRDRYGAVNHGHDMTWGGSQWGGFGMVLGPIFMILIVVGIVAGIIYLLRHFGAAGPGSSSHAAHDRALAANAASGFMRVAHWPGGLNQETKNIISH